MRAMLAAMLLLVSGAGCVGGDTNGSESLTPSTGPTPEQSSLPAEGGPIEPGRYEIPSSEWSLVDFSIRFPKGWTAEYGHSFLKQADGDVQVGLYAVEVDEVLTHPCQGGEDVTEVGPGVYDLAEALLRQPGPRAEGLYRRDFGGYPAISINLSIPKTLNLDACDLGGIGLQIWYSDSADKDFVLLNHSHASVYILEVDGQRQVFLVQYQSEASRKDKGELWDVVESIQIET